MDKANLCESDFIEETLREMEKSSAFYLRTKNYILDTSVLIQDPKSIFAFEDNNVIITGTTLQELDKRMSHNRENLFVSQIAGSLKSLMECGNLRDGIQLSNGGYLIVEPDGVNERNLPDGFSVKSADNRIISTCVTLMQRNPDAKFTLVTNKSLMAVNASVCGVNVESYQNGRIKDTGYTGYEKVVVNDENIINDLVQDRRVSEDDMRNAIVGSAPERFYPNEFVLVVYEGIEILTIFQKDQFKKLPDFRESVYGVRPLNNTQRCLLYSLCAPVSEIPLVIINGPAGTGKTLLSIAAGLDALDANASERPYNNMLITRNNVMADDDFGYLPGTLKEKMEPLLMPFKDAISNLVRMKKSTRKSNMTNMDVMLATEQFFQKGLIDILPLAYIRGRSLKNAYVIVDEAQNTPQLLMKDILTRPEEGTKIVISGDPVQIDNELLDRDNNGLALAIERMKDSPLAALITFGAEECNRSPLAADALRRLDDIRKDGLNDGRN